MKIWVNKGNYGWQTRGINGEDKIYIDVGFKKGNEPNNPFCQIKINDGFFSLYKTKTGLPKPKLIIMDYEVISKSEYEEDNNYEQEERIAIQTEDLDDLPF